MHRSLLPLLLAAAALAAGCASTVSVRGEPAGARIFYRGRGRPTFRWTAAPAGDPATFRVYFGVQVIDKLENVRFHFLEVADFGEHVLVVRFDNQLAILFFKAQQTVTIHVVLNFGHHGFRNRETALAF